MSLPNPEIRNTNAGSLVERQGEDEESILSSPMKNSGSIWKGFPMEGPDKLRKESDPEPVLSGTPHAELFDLSKKDDLKRYNKCLQKIAKANNIAMQEEAREFSPVTGNFMILLRYNEYFYVEGTKEDEK